MERTHDETEEFYIEFYSDNKDKSCKTRKNRLL